MKIKIIIGLLSLGIISIGTYAIIENNMHAKELKNANNTIFQYSETIKEKETLYNDLLKKINILEKQIDTFKENNISEKITEVENSINKLQTDISNINNKCNSIEKSDIDKAILGKWKDTYEENINNDNGEIIKIESKETIYEFKEDKTFYINDIKNGNFDNGSIITEQSDIAIHFASYKIKNGQLIMYLPKKSHIYTTIYEVHVLEKIN